MQMKEGEGGTEEDENSPNIRCGGIPYP